VVQLARIRRQPVVKCRQDLRLYLGKGLPLNLLMWGGMFVVLPLFIYYLSYAMLPAEHGAFSAEGWGAFRDQQLYQWGFHADKEGGHGSNALFFTWPFLLQPASMFRSGGLPAGVTATLNIMGNPAVWWAGFLAMLGVGWRALSGRDKTAVFLAGIYFLQGLPWLLVTRTTFIYHYLPFLPLLILAICYWLARLDLRRPSVRIVLALFGILVIGGFALYYPYVTALPVPKTYTDAVRVFDSWSRL
jgi:dolichyl-phosphate-mannose--protein O-mannosyl transferase